MKLLVLLLSLLLMCLAPVLAEDSFVKPSDYVTQINTFPSNINKDSDNAEQIIQLGVHLLVKNKYLKALTSFLGPAETVVGIMGDIMKIFEDKGPNIEKLFAEQISSVNESFIAMSIQVIFPFLNWTLNTNNPSF